MKVTATLSHLEIQTLARNEIAKRFKLNPWVSVKIVLRQCEGAVEAFSEFDPDQPEPYDARG